MTEGLRARKAEKVHHALMRSAFRLFRKQGFDATTVDEIASAVDLSPRTFFRYFGSKEDLVFGDTDHSYQELQAILRDVPPGIAPFEALEQAVVRFAEGLEPRREEYRFRAQLIASSSSLQARGRREREEWGEALAQALSQREGDGTEISNAHHMLASIAVSALGVAMRNWVGPGEATPLAPQVRAMLAQVQKEMA